MFFWKQQMLQVENSRLLIGSSGSNSPGTSTSLAFHHWDGSAWNNEIEFDSSGNITLDGSIMFSNNSKLRQDSAGLIMETLISDEDLLFIGNDGVQQLQQPDLICQMRVI